MLYNFCITYEKFTKHKKRSKLRAIFFNKQQIFLNGQRAFF